jgi:esterase/lipase superfamily enzyme
VDLKTFPIYFATNRKRDPKQHRVAFSSDRNLGELTLGIVKVVVLPPQPLSVGGGRNEKAELHLSDTRHLAIQPAELGNADQLVRAARERLFGARTYLGQALVFVHGYNVSFDNAIRRAGQLAYDLAFDGPVFAFSWPSAERLLSYVGDRESAQLSADALREFIETVVAETKARRIHIIAHSMGNVALIEALFTLAPETLAKLNIGEMVLASPDLDPDLFERTYKRLQQRGATGTIYAASSDWALWLSSGLRDRPQLGYIPPGGPTRLVAGTDLIDITAVNSDIFSLNHDLYANSTVVIGDLRYRSWAASTGAIRRRTRSGEPGSHGLQAHRHPHYVVGMNNKDGLDEEVVQHHGAKFLPCQPLQKSPKQRSFPWLTSPVRKQWAHACARSGTRASAPPARASTARSQRSGPNGATISSARRPPARA